MSGYTSRKKVLVAEHIAVSFGCGLATLKNILPSIGNYGPFDPLPPRPGPTWHGPLVTPHISTI